MVKKFPLFILTLILSLSICRAETIKLKNGKTVQGSILERTKDYIKVDISGISITYYFDEIENIDDKNISVSEITTNSPVSTPKSPQDIFETVSPAVVSIITKTSSGEQSLGSGFIVDSQGIIVTNYHVTDPKNNLFDNKDVLVKLKDGRVYPPRGLTTIDQQKDLCVFSIKAQNLSTVTLGNSQNSKVGDIVYAIGNPRGLENSFSNGMLSGIRIAKGNLDTNIKYLQFTAPVAPGNSGGPLLNSQGQVIGIVSAGGLENLNFALPIENAYADIGYVSFVMLGKAQEAIVYFKKALQIEPDKAILYAELGMAYKELGQHSEAKANYQKAKDLYHLQKNYQEEQSIEETLKELP